MRCPTCENRELDLSSDGEVFTCGQCRGLFLGVGELDRMAGPHVGDLEFSTLDLDTFEHPDESPSIRCPRCGDQEMDKVEFNIHSGLILDHCGHCGGFWLDGGELERIRHEVEELSAADREVSDPPLLSLVKALWTLVS